AVPPPVRTIHLRACARPQSYHARAGAVKRPPTKRAGAPSSSSSFLVVAPCIDTRSRRGVHRNRGLAAGAPLAWTPPRDRVWHPRHVRPARSAPPSGRAFPKRSRARPQGLRRDDVLLGPTGRRRRAP